MGEIGATGVTAYQQLGALGFLIVAMVLAFAFLVWRIVKSQDRTTTLQDKMFERLDTLCSVLAMHDRQAQGMDGKLDASALCMTNIKVQLGRIEGVVSK